MELKLELAIAINDNVLCMINVKKETNFITSLTVLVFGSARYGYPPIFFIARNVLKYSAFFDTKIYVLKKLCNYYTEFELSKLGGKHQSG